MNEHVKEFRPELISPKGAYVAWGLGIVMLVFTIFIRLNADDLSVFPTVLTILLLVAGIFISLSNWVDRKTVIRLDLERVHFENGLRNVDLRWHQIEKVVVSKGMLDAKKIQVIGNNQMFSFNTVGSLYFKGESRGSTGFVQGDLILKKILQECDLEKHNDPQADIYYYYRK